MAQVSRAKKLYERLTRIMEDNTEETKNYYLYIPGNYSWEEATILNVVAKQGNKVKFQWLETDIDDKDEYAPTGELDQEDLGEGTLGVLNGYEYISSSEFSDKNDKAFKITKPMKYCDMDNQGRCPQLESKVVSEADPGDYYTPPTPAEVEFYCTAQKRGKSYGYCDMEKCPNGPFYFMQYGLTDNVDIDELENNAIESHEDDKEYWKARARGWDD